MCQRGPVRDCCWAFQFSLAPCPIPPEPKPDIVRRFLTRGDLDAVFPIVAELAHKIERAGDEDGVFRGSAVECMFKRPGGIGNDGRMQSVVSGDFCKLRHRDCARSWRLRVKDVRGVGKEDAGNFIDGLGQKSSAPRKQRARAQPRDCARHRSKHRDANAVFQDAQATRRSKCLRQ